MSNSLYEYEFAEINGKNEIVEFLDSLNSKDKAKIIAYMDKLVDLLNNFQFPNEKLSKYLKNGIFELRVSLKNTTSRCFYFFLSEKNIIFTHGYIKKVEKTPNSEIEKAIKVKELYWSKTK